MTELRKHIQGMSLSNKSALPMTCLTVLSQSKHGEVGEATEKKRMLCQFLQNLNLEAMLIDVI